MVFSQTANAIVLYKLYFRWMFTPDKNEGTRGGRQEGGLAARPEPRPHPPREAQVQFTAIGS